MKDVARIELYFAIDLTDYEYLLDLVQSGNGFFQENRTMTESEGYVTTDDGVRLFFQKFGSGQKEGPSGDPSGFGKKMWSLMRLLYVVDPRDADKIRWPGSALPNESLFNVMKQYREHLLPSIRSISLTPEDFARAKMPVLVIHGRKDRHAPYGGGKDWATLLPNARLMTIENAAHLPWIESPESVFGAIQIFLDGAWPDVPPTVRE